MSDEAEGQEPTMEEILASIRRIISEDDEEGGETEGATEEVAADPAPEPEPEAEDEEVMDLTEMVMEEPEPEPEPEPTPEPEPEEEPLELEVAPEPEPEPEPEPVVEAVAPVEEVEDDIDFGDPFELPEEEEVTEPEPSLAEEGDSSLISGTTETATAAAFGALTSSLLTSNGDSRTLEDLVADMLRPMLKEWMDQNLPDLVERMVREEIERVARRGR